MFRTFLATTSVSLLLASLAAASAADRMPVGSVTKVEHQATAIQGSTARLLDAKDELMFKDKLRTGPGGRLEAKLDDGSMLTLGENGRMTIDDFVYRPDKDGGKLALSVPTGAFLFVGGKVEGATGGNVAIQTPVGTIGVRGTTVWGGQIDGGFGVLVLSGEVSLTTKRGTVMMHKGQGTMVYNGKSPADAAPWPDDRTKRAVASISFPDAN